MGIINRNVDRKSCLRILLVGQLWVYYLGWVEDVCGMGSHITRRSAGFHSLLINWNSAKHTLSAVIANHPQLPPPNNQPMPTRSKLHKASQYTRMV